MLAQSGTAQSFLEKAPSATCFGTDLITLVAGISKVTEENVLLTLGAMEERKRTAVVEVCPDVTQVSVVRVSRCKCGDAANESRQ